VTLEEYRRRKLERLLAETRPRSLCRACRKPPPTCYCARIRAFHPSITFVILIHPEEVPRSVATGRMTHLCLANSRFFEGEDFSEHEEVNAIVRDPRNFPLLLYPGKSALNLSTISAQQRQRWLPRDRRPVAFVFDGTWRTAKRIRRLSRNLHGLPEVTFSSETLSAFGEVRKQPEPGCFSTIEAVHHVLRLFSDDSSRAHDNLLDVFLFMVNQQLAYERQNSSQA